MAIIDLDQQRTAREAARASAKKKPDVVKFGEEEFELPTELPCDFIDFIQAGRMHEAAVSLFGEEKGDAFMAHRPTLEDLNALGESVVKLSSFGGLPESRASRRSSKSTTKRSRPTSRATTT